MYQHSQELHLAILKPMLWVSFFWSIWNCGGGILEVLNAKTDFFFLAGRMRRPLPDLFKRNIWASWIMLETESLQGRPQSKNPEQWQPSLTKEDLAGGQGEQGCGEVPVAPLSILYISDKLGGTESWVNSSKQCQGSQPHPLDPPHLHKVSQVPSPRSQEPRSHFPARPPPWMMEGKSS